jgi:hypothetical protein
MARRTRETWAARVQRWRASGMTAREFAHRAGINPATLRWWSSRLGRAPHGGTTIAVPPLTFVEMTHATRSEPIEVVLVSGVRLRVLSDVTVQGWTASNRFAGAVHCADASKLRSDRLSTSVSIEGPVARSGQDG